MSDTRPNLTENEFERYAAMRAPDWWAVGEHFAYAPEVRAVEGWQNPNSPGHRLLTQAQRDLIVWIEIVREAGNGGISGFFQDKKAFVVPAEAVVERLGWPELQRNYLGAARGYMSIGGRSMSAEEWLRFERDLWEDMREQARRFQRKNGTEPVTGEQLDRAVVRMQFSGLIKMRPNREHPDIDRFDEWFHHEDTKMALERFVGGFIRRNDSQLARIVSQP